MNGSRDDRVLLDERSGVSPYLQVVQQVRRALRLGLLEKGDQLPTVKDVVASLAINPNTVLKAYRELERDGLVAARPGVGTFVTRTLATPSLAAHEPLRTRAGPVAGQRSPGRPRRGKHRRAVHQHLSLRRRGNSVTAILSASGLGKRYRRTWALRNCTLNIPEGCVTGLVGPNGAGKTTLLNLAVGMLEPTEGTHRGLRRPPGRRRGPAGQGRLRRPGHPDVRRTQHRRPPPDGRAPQPAVGRSPSRSPASTGSASTRSRRPAGSPAVSGRSSP